VRRSLLLVAIVVALAGCGGGSNSSAEPALKETSRNLAKIESGILSLSVRMAPEHGDEVGYSIEGPVQLAAEGELPLADVEYTQRANGQEETVRLVLTEAGGWVERDGSRIDLTQSQLDQLRASGSLLGQGGLEDLGFEKWIADTELSDGPDETDKVTGELDVVAAMNGLAGLSGLLAGGAAKVTESHREDVEDAVEDSSFELLTGKEDRLLRKLAIMFELDADVPEELREALGEERVGARFEFDLSLDEVNQPVQIG
jgi:hypothetical protein